ncbi:MAG TPA: uroporphyrinogen-III synthase, partial [Gaiellaceae bacterium]|nr:uroporphyrinogen-III synthase [Gaiellaceae bacterium]
MGPASKPLRVIVTRARGQIEPLASRIEALGHEVVRCPLIELEPIGPKELDVEPYDWVVVTSPFGAAELLRRARGRLPQLAAIGPGTAAALREGSAEPALVARVSTQEGLLAELPRPAGRVLFAGAER